MKEHDEGGRGVGEMRIEEQAEQAKEQARITAFAAHTAALRARAANDPSGAAAAAADAKIAEDAEVAEMAPRAWAGETAEISDDTLQRWSCLFYTYPRPRDRQTYPNAPSA